MNVQKRFYGLVGLGILSIFPSAFSTHAEELELDEVVISAGRVPVETEKVGRANTVISGEELERSQTRYVADALRRVPGVAVSRTGSFGGLTQIRVRGSEGNHVLVLIDGVEVAATSQGEFDFGGLQVSDVERIEVLRGPQSALYGSNATSGVIHIITKGGVRNDFQVTAKTEAGSDETFLGNIGIRGGGETFDVAASASFRRTQGFNISDFGTEEDGDRNTTLNGKANWEVTNNVKFDFNFRYVNRDSDTDDQDFAFPATPTQGLIIDTNSNTETKEFYGGASLSWSLFDNRFVQKSRFEITDLERRNRTNNGLSGNDDRRYHVSHQGTYFFDTEKFFDAKHSLTGAFEWERETFQNAFPTFDPSQADQQERNLFGYVAEYRGEFKEKFFLSGALRFDQNDDFEDTVTYSASAAYLFEKTGTRLHSSIGTGVTNPTFSEQFGFIPVSFQGNPDLRPEENFGWDIGIEQKFFDERVTADITYFNERLEDEIQTQFLPGSITSPVNLDGTSKRQGIEISAAVELTKNLFVKGSYTFLDAEEPSGLTEVRRPKHLGSINANYAFHEGRGNLFLDAIYNGDTQDLEFISATPETRVTLDDFFLVNIGADYQVTEKLQVFGRVENLFNEDYEEVFGFNTQGITGFFGMKATF